MNSSSIRSNIPGWSIRSGSPAAGPGRPRKGGEVKKPLTRLQRQQRMALEEMIGDLPSACDFGVRKDSGGCRNFWKGYKLHADVADGGIPVSCLLTSASLLDSQAALPLAAMSAERADSLCDLMDSAYDAGEIRECSLRLKDQFGAKHVRVRGYRKVFCHLMFGVIALLTDQMMRMNI